MSVNNRGHEVLTAWSKNPEGVASEKFKNCVLDFDAWIEFAKSKGHKQIVLQGHSLGAEKVVYYMNNGKYKDNVIGVILLGPASSCEYQNEFMTKKNLKEKLFSEAHYLIQNNKGYQFLTSYWLSHFGVAPRSASKILERACLAGARQVAALRTSPLLFSMKQ